LSILKVCISCSSRSRRSGRPLNKGPLVLCVVLSARSCAQTWHGSHYRHDGSLRWWQKAHQTRDKAAV
jgi:hypothetical protein